MSVTTSYFYLQTREYSNVTAPNLATYPLTLTSSTNKIWLNRRFQSTSVNYEYTVPLLPSPIFANVAALVAAINTAFVTDASKTPPGESDSVFNAVVNNNSVRIESAIPFSLEAQSAGGHVAMGFGSSLINSGTTSFTASKNYTFEPLEFYPPSTISGKNVFMRLVNVEIFQLASTTARIPFALYLENLQEPVGTYSDAWIGSTSSKRIGVVASKSENFPGPLILTYIPDGKQTLTFRLQQLYENQVEIHIFANTVLGVHLEFVVPSPGEN